MKIALFILILAVSGLCNGQSVTGVNPLTKEDYLLKSKHQKAGYLITGGAGIILLTVGVIEATQNLDLDPFGMSTQKNRKLTTADALALAGIGLVAVSIALIIASHQNKKRAAALSINSNYRLFQNQKGITYRRIPSLSLTIPL